MKKNFDTLQQSMNINPPSFYSISDSVLNFKRTNRLNIDWNEISGNKPNPNRMGYLLDYFLENTFEDIEKGSILSNCQDRLWSFYTYSNKGVDEIIFGIKIQPSGRIYVLRNGTGFIKELDITPFLDKTVEELFTELKKKDDDSQFLLKIGTLSDRKLIFNNPQEYEHVSREALFYLEKFQNISSKLEFITLLNNRINQTQKEVNGVNRSFVTDLFSSDEELNKVFFDSDLLDFYISNLSRIRSIEIELKNEINVIVRNLLEKGYYLHTNKLVNSVTILGITGNVEYGKIYSVFKEQISVKGGTSTEEYWEDEGKMIYEKKTKDGLREIDGEWVPKLVKKTRIITLPDKLDFKDALLETSLKEDPIFNKVLELKKKGNEVHIIEKSNRGFINTGGEDLDSIIYKCVISEKTRINTVLVFHEYDNITENKKGIIGGKFYYFPLPEVLPSQLPSIALNENLNYRMSWNGLEVGKLLSSINLAPGETKSVSITSKYSSINSISNSSKSFNEISSLDSSEVTNEFETLATRELEKTNESSSSISAGGSYGGFEASGNASQNSKETLKNFNKDFSKLTNKVTKTLNKKASLEISSSSNLTVQNSSDTSRTSNISNINQGATLNLYYFQLNNKFRTCLFIDDLKFLISSSTEKIEGSGIYDVIEIKVQNIEQLIEAFKFYLPNGYFNYKETKIKSEILKSVIKILNEYTDMPLLCTDDEKKIFKFITTDSIKVEDEIAKQVDESAGDYEKLLSSYKLLTSSIDFNNLIVSEDNIILDSGSYYLDSQVGINPATEAYSERMRNLEALKVESQIDNQIALTNEVKAKNQLLNFNATYINDIFILHNNGTPDKIENTIVLNLSEKVINNSWDVYIKNSKINPLSIDLANDGNTILIKTNAIIPNKEELKQTLILINLATKIVMRYI